MTDRPPAPPRTQSGQHKAVSAYRDKLDSIVDGEAEDLKALDRRLSEYIQESTNPPPMTVEDIEKEFV